MSFLENTARSAKLFAQDLASLVKIIIRSAHTAGQQPVRPGSEIFILGNGPSLRKALDDHAPRLAEKELMAVNFFANTPDFPELRPSQYILADSHFFEARDSDPNVRRLWENLSHADWDMTLHVPADRREYADRIFPGHVRTFNLTPVEGHATLCNAMMRRGLAMPRPRNVMIAAVVVAVLAGYENIYLLGADHSWSRTLCVDSRNRVLSRQPHFYEDNEEELDRVASEYQGYHLHDILNSLTIAFRSYHRILDYISRTPARVTNLTPDSMIDAFPRADLGQILRD